MVRPSNPAERRKAVEGSGIRVRARLGMCSAPPLDPKMRSADSPKLRLVRTPPKAKLPVAAFRSASALPLSAMKPMRNK